MMHEVRVALFSLEKSLVQGRRREDFMTLQLLTGDIKKME